MNLGDVDTRRYFFWVAVVLIFLFVLLNPEGSSRDSFPLALLQWTVQVAVPLVFAISLHIALSRSRVFERLGPWICLAVSGLLAGLLFTPVALALDLLMGVDDPASINDLRDWALLALDELGGVVPPVLIVWLAINAPRVLNLDFRDPREGSRPESTASTPPTIASTAVAEAAVAPRPSAPPESAAGSFFRKLPRELGDDVVYLMSELHYLRVVTTRGSALILYTLRDAISELSQTDGLQPHRSYWVASAHVRGLRRRGNAWRLELEGGELVPVSRRRQSEVRSRWPVLDR